MTFSSSVPQLQFTPAGLVMPTESEILDGQLADINAAFGGGLNLSLETPQGQLASSITAAIGDKNAELAYLVNQLDPRYASGKFQDAIGRFYFLERKPAIATRVACIMTGVAGLVVPAGTLAADTSGNIYELTQAVSFGIGISTGIGYFDNVVAGPIPCPATTLNRVYQAVAGLDAITNAADGIIGKDIESRADFEFRRYNSVAIGAHGGVGAIYSEVFDVAGVTDVYIKENETGATITVGATSVAIVKNSVYVCAQGGLDFDIAKAIARKKSTGCNTNGSTSVVVPDTSGYSVPYPTYTIKLQRPTLLPIKFAVQIAASTTLPTNLTADIKAAIVARFNGQDGTNRERIGSTVFATRYYSAVAIGGASVLSILIGTSTATLVAVDVGIDRLPTITESDITVTYV